MLFRIDLLDVQHDQIDYIEPVIWQQVRQQAIGVERGMQAEFFLAAAQHLMHKFRLHQRFAAADGDAAAGFQEQRHLADIGEYLIYRPWCAVLTIPCVRVVAVKAAHLAAGHEQHEAQPRAINCAAGQCGVDVGDQIARPAIIFSGWR